MRFLPMSAATRFAQPLLLLAIVGSFLVSLAGCGGAADGRIAAERKRLVLSEEPSGATSIAEARKNLILQPEVTLVGTIGAADQETFQPGPPRLSSRKRRPRGTATPVTTPTPAPSAAIGRKRRRWPWCSWSTRREKF